MLVLKPEAIADTPASCRKMTIMRLAATDFFKKQIPLIGSKSRYLLLTAVVAIKLLQKINLHGALELQM